MAKVGGGDLATHLFARTNFFFLVLVWSTYEEDKTEDEQTIKKSLELQINPRDHNFKIL